MSNSGRCLFDGGGFVFCFPFPSLFIKNQNATSPAHINSLHLSLKEEKRSRNANQRRIPECLNCGKERGRERGGRPKNQGKREDDF